MIVGVPDKLLVTFLKGLDCIVATDEGEAVGLAAGYWIATKQIPLVFMSADGFCNALNPLTSYVIPENIPMFVVISFGRQEPQHKVMSDSLKQIIKSLKYDPKKLHFLFIEKKPESHNRWFAWFNK
jgi:phosphonopyruvate decarboxylase